MAGSNGKVKLPWMPLYPKDLLVAEEVACMTNEQLGAYVRLLAFEWLEGSLPEDEKALRRLSNSGRRWGSIRGAIMPLFSRTRISEAQICATDNEDNFSSGGFRLISKRLQAERAKALDLHKKRSDSAKKRWEKADASASALDMLGTTQPQPQPHPLPHTHLLSSKNTEAGKKKPIPWHLVDTIGAVLKKVNGNGRMEGDHPDRAFHVVACRSMSQAHIYKALAYVQDRFQKAVANGEKPVENPSGYFATVIRGMATEEGISLE